MSRSELKLSWFSALRWFSMRFTKVEKWVETEMIQCFEIMTDLQKQRSEEELRWFNTLRWPCTSLIKAEWRRCCSMKIPISPLWVHFSHLQPSLTLTIRTFWSNKKKRKETDYIFVHQCCCLSLYIIFDSTYWCIITIFNTGEFSSSFFSWHT